VRYQDRDETDTFIGTFFAPTDPGFFFQNGPPSLTVTTAPAGDFQPAQLSNFFKGGTSVPSAFWQYTRANAAALQHTLDTYAVGLGYDATFGNPPQNRHPLEQTADAYLEVKFGHDWTGWLPPFTGNAGVRVVHNDVQSRGSYTVVGGTPFYTTAAAANTAYQSAGGAAAIVANPSLVDLGVQSLTPSTSLRTGTKQYIYALPAINIAFKPHPDWILRFAIGQTLSQPNFADITTSGTVSTGSKTPNPNQAALSAYVLSKQGANAPVPQLAGIITNLAYNSGNTQLNPAISTNEDISVEWYPSASTAPHIDVFNKRIRNEIIYNNNTISQVVPTNAGPYTGSVQSISDYNSKIPATLTGVEIGGRTYFDMLPGALKGIGVEANYTIIDSHSPGSYATGMDGNSISGLPIPLLSRYNYNVNLLYDLGRWDARLAYSWRSQYLLTTTDVGLIGSYISQIDGSTINYSLPNFAAATGQMDAHISYKINDHITVGFAGANLLNAINRTVQEIVPGQYATRSWFMNDVRYSVNLSGKF
jgi:iron complex outermembrane receptor protein